MQSVTEMKAKLTKELAQANEKIKILQGELENESKAKLELAETVSAQELKLRHMENQYIQLMAEKRTPSVRHGLDGIGRVYSISFSIPLFKSFEPFPDQESRWRAESIMKRLSDSQKIDIIDKLIKDGFVDEKIEEVSSTLTIQVVK